MSNSGLLTGPKARNIVPCLRPGGRVEGWLTSSARVLILFLCKNRIRMFSCQLRDPNSVNASFRLVDRYYLSIDLSLRREVKILRRCRSPAPRTTQRRHGCTSLVSILQVMVLTNRSADCKTRLSITWSAIYKEKMVVPGRSFEASDAKRITKRFPSSCSSTPVSESSCAVCCESHKQPHFKMLKTVSTHYSNGTINQPASGSRQRDGGTVPTVCYVERDRLPIFTDFDIRPDCDCRLGCDRSLD